MAIKRLSPLIDHKLENSTGWRGISSWTDLGTPTYDTGKFGDGIDGQDNNFIHASYDENTFPLDDFTVEFWYKPDEASTAGGDYPFVIQGSATNIRIYLNYIGSNQCRVDLWDTTATRRCTYTFTINFSASDLFHQAITFESAASATNRQKVYKDGSSLTYVSNVADNNWSFGASTYTLSLGGWKDIPTASADGIVDNFKLYDEVHTTFEYRNYERMDYAKKRRR